MSTASTSGAGKCRTDPPVARTAPAAPKVTTAEDTTGAGDAFVGALAAKLAEGAPLEEAVPYAVLAGAVAVTREGAQGSLPTPEEVEKFRLCENW